MRFLALPTSLNEVALCARASAMWQIVTCQHEYVERRRHPPHRARLGAASVPLRWAVARGMGFEVFKAMLQPRSPERLPDGLWRATVQRVRSEFEEMPCLRLSRDQAATLFGLRGVTCDWVLGKLMQDGFLVRTSSGEYLRNNTTP